MSGCLDCGQDCQGARCQVHQVKHSAPELTFGDDGKCPDCGRDQLTNERCADCRGGDA